MSKEPINQALQAELQVRFGIVFPELTQKPTDLSRYMLTEYSLKEGYVRLEETVNAFGKKTEKPEGFVEYIPLDDEERRVARREGHFEHWTGSDNLKYADIEFIQGDTVTAYTTPPYQFKYDHGQEYGEQVSGGTIRVQIKDIADRSNEFDLIKAFYGNKEKLFTINIAYGEREELRDYHRKKRQQVTEQRRIMYASGIFEGHDLSFPGVELMTPDEKSSNYRIEDKMKGILQHHFSGTIRIGERVIPKETKPYAYEIDSQQGQFVARRIDTTSGSIWIASVPEHIDFMQFYTKSTTSGREWTTIRHDFPVELEMK